ncbi:MAG TPA: hypothetical protein VMF32_14165 [Xanthobacteraceae bacterium]|nr:hypothetical protein [Xanthobacteraceae bacterium]
MPEFFPKTNITEPGLNGIVASVKEGRRTFQRILTYTLRSIVHKMRQVLFLAIGLIMTGHAIFTPMLMVLSMITGDFLAMSSTTDNVRPSAMPNSWRIDNLTVAGNILGVCDLGVCAGVLALLTGLTGGLAFVVLIWINVAISHGGLN